MVRGGEPGPDDQRLGRCGGQEWLRDCFKNQAKCLYSRGFRGRDPLLKQFLTDFSVANETSIEVLENLKHRQCQPIRIPRRVSASGVLGVNVAEPEQGCGLTSVHRRQSVPIVS